MNHKNWSKAVITVNGEDGGRGFVIELDDGRYVLTAAHCLGDELPPARPDSYFWERTYKNILGPLGETTTVTAECLFVDPVADIAVLGQPDNQELSDEADAYDELVNGAVPLPIGGLAFTRKQYRSEAEADVFMLALQGHWFSGHATSLGKAIWFDTFDEPIAGGMSGSPTVTPDGRAVGVVSSTMCNPLLMDTLPGWILRQVTDIPSVTEVQD